MDIVHIETLPFYENIQAHTIKDGVSVPSGPGFLIPNPMQHDYILKLDGQTFEIELDNPQDKANLDAEFCRPGTRLCNVKSVTKNNILFDLYVFAGIADDFGQLDLYVEKQNVGALQNKEHKPDFDKVCEQLPEKCALTVNGEKYFIIQADSEIPAPEKDSEDEADSDEDAKSGISFGSFSIFCEHFGKCYGIQVKQQKISADGEETFFSVTRIAPRKNMRPAGNFHLVKGNLSFGNLRKKAAELNREKLSKIISEDSGSYLKAWKEYTGARGDRILKNARLFADRHYERAQISAGSAILYFRTKDGEPCISEIVSQTSAEEIIVCKKGDALPLFLENKTCDFLAYCDLKEAERKEKKTREKGIACEIVSAEENSIEVRASDSGQSLENLPQEGYAVLSMRGEESQITRQNNAWKQIAEGRAGINYLGSLLEGNFDFIGRMQKGRAPKITERVRKKIFKNHPPTERQLEAINIALQTPDIALVQGPPGTGKTTVVTAILEILNEMSDKRGTSAGQVLINAYQHDAVYNMIMDDKGKPRISVNGIPTWKYGERKNGANYSSHIDDWCRQIEEKVLSMNPNVRMEKSEELFYAYVSDYVYSPLPENRTRLLEYMAQKLPLTNELAERARTLSLLSEKAEEPQKKEPSLLRKINALRTTEKAFGDDGLKRAEELYFALEDIQWFDSHSEAEKILMEAAESSSSSSELLSGLKKLKSELLEAFSRQPRYVPDEADEAVISLCKDAGQFLESRRGKADKKERIIAEWIQALQSGSAAFSRAIKDLDFVYASTSQQSDGDDIRKQKREMEGMNSPLANFFPVVITDEAARAAPPDLLIPMCKASRKIILVGDHRQLPQLVDDDLCNAVYDKIQAKMSGEKGETEAKKDDFDYESAYRLSLFELLFKQLKKLEEKDGIKRTVTLDQQFRTHPVLGKFCSRLFYEPHGEHYDSPRKAEDFSHSLPGIENKAAVWIDVPANAGKEKKLTEGSWTRECEADCIAEKLVEFVQSQKKSEEDKKLSFGVISFYRGQVGLIQKKLDRHKGILKGVQIKVGTVDSFQGMEFDAVFLSVVRTNKKAQYGFLTSFNRMCVSMSRQKKVLIAVGDREFVTTDEARKPKAIPALAEFYDLCAGVCENQDNEGYGAVLEWKK